MSPNDLRSKVSGVVLLPGDEGFDAELAGADTGVSHRPDVAVGIASDEDAATAVLFAQRESLPLSIVSTGHGIHDSVTSGLMITTRRLDAVSIDPATRLATVGAGTRWSDVLSAAAEHGLTAISGSSPNVGTVGYTLGGGLGPLARSHGYTSDWVRGFTVVLASGEIVHADATENPDLFWALRGGKGGFGVVTGMTVELVPLASIYAGDLYFDEPDIDTAIRAWADWTASAPDEVSTSVALTHYPPFDAVPTPLRGRHLMALRFAYPGDASEGARVAEGVRSIAPVYLDQLGNLPTAQLGRIHNDRQDPGQSWGTARLLDRIDQDFLDGFLEHVGPGVATPFVSVELRHLGARASVDVPEGSAVGGRAAGYSLFAVGVDPSKFERELPDAAASLLGDLDHWVAEEGNINFAGDTSEVEDFERNWSAPTRERLAVVRTRVDPEGVFAYGPAAG